MSTPEAPAEPVVEPPAEPEAEGAKPDEPLGEAGLAALKSEREARKAAEKAATEAAARIKEYEDRDKTDAQKAAERLAEIERENAELKTAKLRAEVAEAKSDPAKGIVIPASLLAGSTKEELEAWADALIAFKGEPEWGAYVPGEGRAPAPTSTEDWLRAAARSA